MEEHDMDFIMDNILWVIIGIFALIIGFKLIKTYSPLNRLKKQIRAIRIYPSGEYFEGLEKPSMGEHVIMLHTRETLVWASEKGDVIFGTLIKSDIKSCDLKDPTTVAVTYRDGEQDRQAIFKFQSGEVAKSARDRIYAAYTNISISAKLPRTNIYDLPVEERLTELQNLRDKDMITQEEYEEKKKAILDEL